MTASFRSLAVLAGLVCAGCVLAPQAQAQVELFFPPATVDRPDVNRSDTNVDGIDGMRFGPIFVSALYRNDLNVGDVARPLRTIRVALCVAQALGGRAVYVDNSGPYPENLKPFPNTELFGSYSEFAPISTFFPRTANASTLLNSSNRLIMIVDNTGSRFTLEGFNFESTNTVASQPTLYLKDTGPATVSLAGSRFVSHNVRSSGANGANGASGGIGLAGSAGGDGSSGTAGTTVPGGAGGAGARFSGFNVRNGGSGGRGASSNGSSVSNGVSGQNADGIGGAGGAGGGTRSSNNGVDGSNGASGEPAINGFPGAAKEFNLLSPNGNDGSAGAPGNGGGGGGGGGGSIEGLIFVLTGGGGGGGGAGGGPGQGGQGGRGGSNTYNVIWNNNAGSSMDASFAEFVTQRGGNGGAGGHGGFGGTGGLGGTNGRKVVGSFYSSGRGGVGGSGSDGGRGGGGAGGAGGASLSLVRTQFAPINTTATSFIFPTGAAQGGPGGYGGFGAEFITAPNGPAGPLVLVTTVPTAPAVQPFFDSEPKVIASAARARTAVGVPITFRPAIMFNEPVDSVIQDHYFVIIQNPNSGRGDFSSSGLDIFYTPNVRPGATPNYDEAFDYTLFAPIYDETSGIILGYTTTPGRGYVSVCLVGELTVNLQDWQGPLLNSSVTPFTLGFADNPAVALNGPVTITNGVSNTLLIPNGTSPLRLKTSHWLSDSAIPVMGSNGRMQYSFSLVNGDCDGDNEVTILDYLVLSGAYGTTPAMSGWDARADLDGDGEVSILDYIILSGNYEAVGD